MRVLVVTVTLKQEYTEGEMHPDLVTEVVNDIKSAAVSEAYIADREHYIRSEVLLVTHRFEVA